MNYSPMEPQTVTSSNPFPFKYIVHSFVSAAALMTSLIGFNGGAALPFDQEPIFRHIPVFYQGISEVDSVYNGCSLSLAGGCPMVDEINMNCKKKLISFLELEPDWDGYDAVTFSPAYIQTALNVLQTIPAEADVYPSPDGYVKFEFSKDDGSYLEIEIREEQKVGVYELFPDQNDREYSASFEDVAKIVRAFYG